MSCRTNTDLWFCVLFFFLTPTGTDSIALAILEEQRMPRYQMIQRSTTAFGMKTPGKEESLRCVDTQALSDVLCGLGLVTETLRATGLDY